MASERILNRMMSRSKMRYALHFARFVGDGWKGFRVVIMDLG